MNGYDLPRYVRNYERELQRYDRFLRIRHSLDQPGFYVVERKTHYRDTHPFIQGTDRQVQYADEYRQIYRLAPVDLRHVLTSLQASDIQAHGGATALANLLDASDDAQRLREDRYHHDLWEAASGEAYERMAWLDGRRVSMAGTRP